MTRTSDYHLMPSRMNDENHNYGDSFKDKKPDDSEKPQAGKIRTILLVNAILSPHVEKQEIL